MSKLLVSTASEIENRIFTFRGLQVMIDRDLAELYQVPVKVLNQSVKRNSDRFPPDFCFQLTKNEFDDLCLRSQFVTSNTRGGIRYMPYAFTEQGVSMLSAILRSGIAVEISIKIMRAFVAMRKLISANLGLVQRIEGLEQKQIETDKKIDRIFDALESKDAIPKCGIFFDGQIFDAYIFVNKIIKSAKKSIVLIDNYINEAVLTMFSEKTESVKLVLLTKEIKPKLSLSIEKFNEQYKNIEAKIFNLSHDRFLIIDNKEIYHLGASLKDLGRKWFAFQKMEDGFSLLEKIEGL